MVFTAVRVARDSSSEQFVKTSHMHVEKINRVPLTRDKEIDVSIADTRSVYPWA